MQFGFEAESKRQADQPRAAGHSWGSWRPSLRKLTLWGTHPVDEGLRDNESKSTGAQL